MARSTLAASRRREDRLAPPTGREVAQRRCRPQWESAACEPSEGFRHCAAASGGARTSAVAAAEQGGARNARGRDRCTGRRGSRPASWLLAFRTGSRVRRHRVRLVLGPAAWTRSQSRRSVSAMVTPTPIIIKPPVVPRRGRRRVSRVSQPRAAPPDPRPRGEQGPDASGDGEDLRQHPQGVPEHGEQAHASTRRQRPADDERHNRSGNGDQDGRGEDEGGKVRARRHGRTVSTGRRELLGYVLHEDSSVFVEQRMTQS